MFFSSITGFEFGQQFCDLMGKVVEEFGPEPMEEDKKRKGGAEPKPNGPVPKRPRPNKKADTVVEAIKLEDLPKDPVLLEVKLSNVRNNASMVLKVLGCLEKSLWVINQSNQEQKLAPGFIVAGFGKGEYKQQAPTTDRELMFDLSEKGLQVMVQSSLRDLEE